MLTRIIFSHAHEVDIPGTVDLNAAEGDDTGYGQALYPVPTDDPNDPLQWPEWKKSAILIICSLYSFLGNGALTGPSVYINIYAEEFGISTTAASGLISYPNLAFGFGQWYERLSQFGIELTLRRVPYTRAFVSQDRAQTSDITFNGSCKALNSTNYSAFIKIVQSSSSAA